MVRETPDYKFGEIAARLEALKESVDRANGKLDSMDGRLRNVEQKSAVYGAVGGGLMSVAVSLVISKFKSLGF